MLLCELPWLHNSFKVFGISKLILVTLILKTENKSASHIASNSVFHKRTKHIELDCHLVVKKLQLGMIAHISKYIFTAPQAADMLIKALSAA